VLFLPPLLYSSAFFANLHDILAPTGYRGATAARVEGVCSSLMTDVRSNSDAAAGTTSCAR